jgi:hypothetical protein
MRLNTLLTLGLLLFSTGCATVSQEKTITLVNAAAGVNAPLLERLRVFAEKELHVRVRTLENPELAGFNTFQPLETAAKQVKTDVDVTLIVLAELNGTASHLMVYPEDGIALVNASPLYTDDAEKFARRMERQVMRAAAFTFGMEPTPDPFCVTRDYRSLADLDSMGRNYSPPWQGRFAKEAARRGLLSLDALATPFRPVPPVP